MSENFQSRVSSVFGSLRHSLKEVADSPLKSDPQDKDYPTSQSSSSHRRRQHYDEHRRFGTRHKHKRSNSNVTPDYIKHPKKWAKCSLSEDGSGQYSGLSGDQINKKAALEFLSCLKSQQQPAVSEDSADDASTCQQNKVVFKRRKPQKIQSESSSSTKCSRTEQGEQDSDGGELKKQGMFVGGVYKMPEYTFGVKMSKKSSLVPPKPSANRNKSIHLCHLEEECD